MKDFVDRQPTKAGRRKITYEDGTSEYVTVEMADEPTTEGTPLNRNVFMEIQGFGYNHTVFNEDGSITEYNENGETLLTQFNDDGIGAYLHTISLMMTPSLSLSLMAM